LGVFIGQGKKRKDYRLTKSTLVGYILYITKQEDRMVYTVEKHQHCNYGFNIEDDIDHDHIATMDDDYDVRKYLLFVIKEKYEDSGYIGKWSVRYKIIWNNEEDFDLWLNSKDDLNLHPY